MLIRPSAKVLIPLSCFTLNGLAGLVISLVLGPSEILLRSSSTKQVKQFGIVSAVDYGNLT